MLDLRADELRAVAHKIVTREADLLAKMTDLEDVINKRVAFKLDAAVAEALEKQRGEALETSSAAELSATASF